MAFNGTNVTIVGNCTRDPELRFTNSGMAVTSFGVAVNFRKMNRQTNEWEEEETTFYDVSCFRQLAENVSDSIQKGSRVIVAGRLRNRSWEGRDGERRSTLEILADEVGPSLSWATAEISKNDRSSGDSGGGGRSQAGGPPPVSDTDFDEEPF